MKPSEEIAMLREALRVERARADEAFAMLDLATAAVHRAALLLRARTAEAVATVEAARAATVRARVDGPSSDG
jgi:hypothetical protein